MYFKFQSDSINTMGIPQELPYGIHFKFQSDSINTEDVDDSNAAVYALNSTLILLIPLMPFASPSIKSFKFQSDSINTIFSGLHSPSYQLPLNSNLILLILHIVNMLNIIDITLNSNLILLILTSALIFVFVTILFKFQSDSINTRERSRRRYIRFDFKFQSDSINTATSL